MMTLIRMEILRGGRIALNELASKEIYELDTFLKRKIGRSSLDPQGNMDVDRIDPLFVVEYVKSKMISGGQKGRSSKITDQSCTAETGCSGGLQCMKFPGIGARCAEPDPCSYYQCPQGTRCSVAVIGGATGQEPIPEPLPPSPTPAPPEPLEDTSQSLEPQVSTPSYRGPNIYDEGEIGQGRSGQTTDQIGVAPAAILPPPGSGRVNIFVGCWAGEHAKPAGPGEASQEDTRPEEGDEDTISYDLVQREEAVFSNTGGGTVTETPETLSLWVSLPPPAPVKASVGPEDDQSGEGSSSVTEPSIPTVPTGILEVADTTAEYEGEVVVREGKLRMNTSMGERAIEILPEVAVTKAKEVVEDTRAEVKNIKLRESTETQTPIYEVRIERKKRLFGLMPVSVETITTVSAEDATVVSIKKPWWRVFAW